LSQPLVECFMLTLAPQAPPLPVTIYHFQRCRSPGRPQFLRPACAAAADDPALSLLAGLVFAPLASSGVPGLAVSLTSPSWQLSCLVPPGAVLATGKISGWIVLGFTLAIAVYLGGNSSNSLGG
jgi:hypothetical protein